MKRNKSPNVESPFPEPPAKVNKTAPVAPSNIPIIFVFVILSFKRKKDKMTTKIGFTVMMIPELIEEDKFNP